MKFSTRYSSLMLRCMNLTSLYLLLAPQSALSVIMPPRLTSALEPLNKPINRSEDFNSLELANDYDTPYLLSINEGESIDLMVQSKSSISVNLNRAVPEDVHVTISVHSRPELITFSNGSVNVKTITLLFAADTFGDRIVEFKTDKAAGHAEIVCKIDKQPKNITIDDTSAFISVNIGKNAAIQLLIVIVGWIYFVAWSASFYFQVILNFQRKSVVGLNFDFLALNLLGFICYTIFNYSLMFSRAAQKDYYNKHQFSRIPVEYNDLFFAAHAVILTLITVIQCFIYERGEQKVSLPATGFIAIAISGGIGCVVLNAFTSNLLTVLDVLLYFSYVKLVITLIKYIPQAYMNYKRKATTGWSIHNILLDFTGGSFSLTQMFLSSYNYDDWISIFGNFTKFGLGVISIFFDILFVTQHYILYKRDGNIDVSSDDSIPSPIISQSVISASFKQPSDDEGRNDQPEAPEKDDDD